MEFDLNEVNEIIVKFKPNDDEMVFKGLGLEKLRKLIQASPPIARQSKTIVIDNAGSDSEERSEEEEPQPPPKKKKGKKSTAAPNGGYSAVSLDYGGPVAATVGTDGTKKGLSPHDIAKEMQRQATATPGRKFAF
jgi:hypothetical protein